MLYFIIYLSVGFGIWLGLVAIRFKQDLRDGAFSREPIYSYIFGFLGGLLLWPILLFFVEP